MIKGNDLYLKNYKNLSGQSHLYLSSRNRVLNLRLHDVLCLPICMYFRVHIHIFRSGSAILCHSCILFLFIFYISLNSHCCTSIHSACLLQLAMFVRHSKGLQPLEPCAILNLSAAPHKHSKSIILMKCLGMLEHELLTRF